MSKSLVDYISRKLYKNEILNDEHLFGILTEYVFELVPQNLEICSIVLQAFGSCQ